MSRRWTGRGSGLVLGCLVSAVTLLGASAPNAFADTPPIDAVTTTTDATTDDAIAAVDEEVTSDITEPAQETSDAPIEVATDPTATDPTATDPTATDPTPTDPTTGTPDTTGADTAATEKTVEAPDVVAEAPGTDVVADGTSDASAGATETASGTSEAPQESPKAVDGTSANVTSAGATTDEYAATDAMAATPDGATGTTSDAIDAGSKTTDDATTDTISAEATPDEQSSSVEIVAASETTSDVIAMIAGTANDGTDVIETQATQTAVREASAITVESSAAILDAAAEATWATFGIVSTEASATVSDVASLETVTDTTSTTADAATTVSHTLSEVMTGVEDVLAFSDLAAQTIVNSIKTTSDVVTSLLGQTSNEAQVILADAATGTMSEAAVTIADAARTLSQAASTGAVTVGGEGGLTDPMGVVNEATESIVSGLDAASMGITATASGDAVSGPETFGQVSTSRGDSSPMRNERLLLGVSRSQAEGETFQGNEPVAPCADPSRLNCVSTSGAGGIDSLVESVASIIRILALTGLVFLPWLAAVGMLVSLGGLALAASRRRRATGAEAALPRGSHVKDAWAYS